MGTLTHGNAYAWERLRMGTLTHGNAYAWECYIALLLCLGFLNVHAMDPYDLRNLTQEKCTANAQYQERRTQEIARACKTIEESLEVATFYAFDKDLSILQRYVLHACYDSYGPDTFLYRNNAAAAPCYPATIAQQLITSIASSDTDVLRQISALPQKPTFYRKPWSSTQNYKSAREIRTALSQVPSSFNEKYLKALIYKTVDRHTEFLASDIRHDIVTQIANDPIDNVARKAVKTWYAETNRLLKEEAKMYEAEICGHVTCKYAGKPCITLDAEEIQSLSTST